MSKVYNETKKLTTTSFPRRRESIAGKLSTTINVNIKTKGF
jgi:hypothetical protein